MASSTSYSQYQLVPQAALTSPFETPTQRYEVLAVSCQTNCMEERNKNNLNAKMTFIIGVMLIASGIFWTAVSSFHPYFFSSGVIMISFGACFLALSMIATKISVVHRDIF